MKHLISLFIVLGFTTCQQKHEPSESTSFQQASVDALLSNGKTLEQTDYDKAAAVYIRSLQQAKDQHYDKGTIIAYRYLVFNKGILRGNFSEGLKWSDNGVKQALQFGNPKFVGDMYAIRATLHHAHSKLDTAGYYYKKAIDLLEAENDLEALTPIYNNVSGLQNLLGNYHLARQYMQRYTTIKEQEKDTVALIGAYSNMYIFVAALRDTLKAVQYLHKAKRLLIAKPENDAAPMVYSNLSESYYHKKQYDSAAHYSNLRLRFALRLNGTLSILKAYDALIPAQLALNKLPEAGASLKAVQQYTQDFDTPLYQRRDIAQLTYQYTKKVGKRDLAFAALETYNDLNDEIRRMEINKDLEQFEQERERSRQEKKMLNKQLQISRKNTTIVSLSAVLGLLLIVGGLVVTWLRKKQTLQQEHISFLEKEKDWNRAKSLLEGQLHERNRISRELHDDLGASLTSIALASRLVQLKAGNQFHDEMAIISSSATEMVQTLNEIVWTLNSRNDSLQSLVAYIHTFIGSFLDKVQIRFEAVENLPSVDVPVSSHVRRAIYLTTKEAFNNIVKHSRASHVLTRIDYNDDWLTISINDNGRGFSSDTTVGNGLLNMHKNMAIAGGTCTVEQQDGVTITLTCRLISN